MNQKELTKTFMMVSNCNSIQIAGTEIRIATCSENTQKVFNCHEEVMIFFI